MSEKRPRLVRAAAMTAISRTVSKAPANDAIDFDLLPGLVGYHLRRAQVSVFARFNQAMAATQITPGQFGVLVLIGANPGLTQSALAKAVGIERSTMVAVIDGLERRKLVERRASPVDRRSHALVLSGAGTVLLDDLKKRVLRHERQFLEALSAEERQTLIRLLRSISAE